MTCIRCKRNEGSFSFRAVEIQEFYIAGKSGFMRSQRRNPEKTQTISGFKEFCACDECIDRKLKDIMNPMHGFMSQFKIGFIVLAFGIVILAMYGGKDNVYTIGGVILVAIALLRAYSFFRKARARRAQYLKMSEMNRRFVTAWECISESAPRREGDHSVFFIPVSSATEKMSRDDFSKYYKLTHENAAEFYRMIHGKSKSTASEPEEEIDEREPNTDLSDED